MNSNDLNRNYQFLKDLGAFEQPSNAPKSFKNW